MVDALFPLLAKPPGNPIEHFVERGPKLGLLRARHDGLFALDVNDHLHDPIDVLLEKENLCRRGPRGVFRQGCYAFLGSFPGFRGDYAMSFRDLDAQTSPLSLRSKGTQKT
jgi:hypothetical protein